MFSWRIFNQNSHHPLLDLWEKDGLEFGRQVGGVQPSAMGSGDCW